ncbi:MAG TPA: D-alanyl-D-alanine carboxypeptidase [Streptosporangiaceae bacterium]|nr:D-alanyl-D-alanine carboxypeptidase [Streptosporangiaceae bacterium]
MPAASFGTLMFAAVFAAMFAAVFAAVPQAMAASAPAGRHLGAARSAPFINAAAGELVNAKSGQELWSRDQTVQRPVASLTKVMTALVVVTAGHLGRRIRITQAEVEYVRDFHASNAGLIAGDILSARNLLYAMLLPSGADAAMALAESYGPGIPAFVRKMNSLARKLHLTRTHFTNFDGLRSSDVSTPANLVKLGEAAMRHKAFRDVVKRKWFNLKAWPHRHHYFWRNTNLLLRRYPGTIGIKTGWTPAAGECLLFEAVYRKKTLIGVILDSAPANSGITFVDAARLLNRKFGRHVPIPPPTPPPAMPSGTRKQRPGLGS